MDYMKGYRLEPNETGFTIIFYLDEHYSEFSDELDAIRLPSKRKYKNFKQYVIKNFSHLNVTKVKVMLGPALVMSFALGADYGSAEATSQQQAAHSHFHEVESGDSLYLIAQQYGTTVEAIKQLNGLSGNTIWIGQRLEVPHQSNDYKVKSGDSLYLIASQFDTTVDSIKQANGLTTDIIYAGQMLTIPTGTSASGTYTVQSGDSLYTIALKHGVSVDALRSANHLKSDVIYSGQTLTIPDSTPAEGPLSVGDENSAVENLQQNLISLGYFNQDPTAYYGSITSQSVRDFQRDYSLNVSGTADQTTLHEVDRALTKQELVNDLDTYTGVPYVWGGDSPEVGFDCSGFVYYMFKKHGVDTTRTTSAKLFNQGEPISRSDLQPGDLVYFAVNDPNSISHVGFYTGNNSFISATSSRGIWEYSMDNSYWSQYYVGANRIY